MEHRFTQVNADFLGDFLRRIEDCVARLSEDQVWWRPNPTVNSVGNQILHLQGNLSQWVLAGLGGVDYRRHRSREFSADRSATKAEMIEGLRGVVGQCQTVIRGLSPDDLHRPRHIQKRDVDGVYAVVHVVEHMSYHAGQIIQIAKELLGPEAGIEFFPQHRGE